MASTRSIILYDPYAHVHTFNYIYHAYMYTLHISYTSVYIYIYIYTCIYTYIDLNLIGALHGVNEEHDLHDRYVIGFCNLLK